MLWAGEWPAGREIRQWQQVKELVNQGGGESVEVTGGQR